MVRQKYYDPDNNRLVFIGENPTIQYWENKWKYSSEASYIRRRGKNIVVSLTKKYLPRGSRILEAGCGNGGYVYDLDKEKFQVEGIDNARDTIRRILNHYPKLNVKYGDVRNLKYKSNTFDGYWSIGVIEHFYDGYTPVIRNIHNILRTGGYAFISFPYMSPIRRLKAYLNLYLQNNTQTKPRDFYQFALDKQEVARRFSNYGFTKVFEIPTDGTKGLKDEIPFLRPILQEIYNSNFFLAKILNVMIDFLTKGIFGHSVILVFKKS